jgi:predicted dehydrogenase/nucleoside-diphosphate-sugar epimerase
VAVPSKPDAADGGALRVALIGCGKMGMQHLRAIASLPNVSVVGVADPQAARAALADVLPRDAIVVKDVDELFARTRPNIVHIVTPPATHGMLARLALQAGCNVYVEKPFTPTRAEAEDLFALAAGRGLALCAGHQYLFERPALLAAEAVGRMGRLVHVESYFSFRQVRRSIAPADQVKDILPHAVYPLLAQLRRGSGLASEAIEIVGVDVRSGGDVYALLRLGQCTGVLVVTLSGRPIEQFQHLVCTNGWVRADYVTGGIVVLPGPGAGLGVLFTPYRRALQTLLTATSGFWRLIIRHQTSYPGLATLLGAFYASIRSHGEPPLSPRSILDTVDVCEVIGRRIDESERSRQAAARTQVEATQALLPVQRHGTAVVTGGTGLLGSAVVRELAYAGFAVRSLSRRVPAWSDRAPGVEYIAADLSVGLDPGLLAGASIVVHCAAETAGGMIDHERNSVAATRHVVQAAAHANVPRILHISSLAVLKPGRNRDAPLHEETPVDSGNPGRGPYVWGKAEAEVQVQRLANDLNVAVKVLRPGPLVDYASFYPPGRLGREVGPIFVAIGPRRSPLSVCDVGTAARVIRWYAVNFDEAPSKLNLVEAPPPLRRELADRFARERSDLRFVWIPAWLLRVGSSPAKLLQRLLLRSSKPVDVYAAFATERYNTDLAQRVIERSGSSVVPGAADVPHHV